MPYHAKTIVVGCGNLLFKDDGFGPIVVNLLEKYFENQTEDDFDPMVISYIENDFSKDVLKEVEDIVCDVDLSGEVKFIDAGNGATHFIFSLPDEYWEKVIVVDVVDYDAEPGSVRTFSPFEMPRDKYENVHTYAVEEPLHELSEKCEVVIVGCKPGEITTPTVDMGLTEEVEKSVPDAIRLILNEIKWTFYFFNLLLLNRISTIFYYYFLFFITDYYFFKLERTIKYTLIGSVLVAIICLFD